MHQHFIVTADAARLRIYTERKATGERPARLDMVETMDFPAGFGRTGAGNLDPTSPVEATGQSALAVAAEVNAFLGDRPEASWDFAGAPALYAAVMGEVAPEALRRLRRASAADLVDLMPEAVRGYFAKAS